MSETPRFSANENGRLIFDDEMHHDAMLRVDGDFESDDERIAYAAKLVDALNRRASVTPPALAPESNNAAPTAEEPVHIYRLTKKEQGVFVPASEWFTGYPDSSWEKLVAEAPDLWRIQQRVTGKQIAKGIAKAFTTPFIGAAPSVVEQVTALQHFNACGGADEPDPIERLRFFCSIAFNPAYQSRQSWIDVEQFFDAVIAAHPPRAPLTDAEIVKVFSTLKTQPWGIGSRLADAVAAVRAVLAAAEGGAR